MLHKYKFAFKHLAILIATLSYNLDIYKSVCYLVIHKLSFDSSMLFSLNAR